VSFANISSVFIVVEAQDYLTKLFGTKVDLVRRQALSGNIESAIMNEVVTILSEEVPI
jgi:predicted nucleotidyltransferase